MRIFRGSRAAVTAIALFAALAVGLAGCSEANPPKRTYTVEELVADPALLADQIAKCRNDPGMLAKTPNCRNVEAADGKSRLERMRKALEG
ncbi:EexN family lipoprotein [Rhizobium sp. PP-F2F-G48]|uniref:EexN family lipoprotein n=1 Tax=Rhizobium sp. PP-F2F-G48 TaxID=2135651 RepID=UPI001404E5BF|nr:EexN family lipoprotein [Rhizobium sp. PP-F2F-G48]